MCDRNSPAVLLLWFSVLILLCVRCGAEMTDDLVIARAKAEATPHGKELIVTQGESLERIKQVLADPIESMAYEASKDTYTEKLLHMMMMSN